VTKNIFKVEKLSLQGNPIQLKPDYQKQIANHFSGLKFLDEFEFSYPKARELLEHLEVNDFGYKCMIEVDYAQIINLQLNYQCHYLQVLNLSKAGLTDSIFNTAIERMNYMSVES